MDKNQDKKDQVEEIVDNLSYLSLYNPENIAEITKNIQKLDKLEKKSVPQLLSQLRKTIENANIEITEQEKIKNIYVILFLAQLKIKKTFPLLINICKMNQDDIDNIVTHDFLFDFMHKAIAFCYNGDLNALKKLY